jgi:hypothetical protein
LLSCCRKKRIRNRSSRRPQDAQALTDAIKEQGNLMTGSWDRIFRQSLAGHKHLKQVNVYIGPLWTNPKESIQMEPDHECLMILSKIKVGAFEPVLCAAVFPIETLEPKAAEEPRRPKSNPRPQRTKRIKHRPRLRTRHPRQNNPRNQPRQARQPMSLCPLPSRRKHPQRIRRFRLRLSNSRPGPARSPKPLSSLSAPDNPVWQPPARHYPARSVHWI